MIKELINLELKLIALHKQLESIIETYKDLHPDEYDIYNEQIDKEKIENLKLRSFEKIRAGQYEISFSKKQR